MAGFNTISKAAIRALLEKYHRNCFSDGACLADVQQYIQSMAAHAIAEHTLRLSGGGITNTSLWNNFHDYVSPANSKITGKLIKNCIREIIEKEQSNQCCYCRRPLLNNAHAKPIEHILPHSIFVQHTFNILNLSISCVDCNAKKSNHVWTSHEGKFRRTRHYPAATAFTDMYHPRFHRYDEHVRFFRVHSNTHCISIYTGLTSQGKNLCKNLLTHISKLEIFVNANSELKNHIETIHEQECKPGSAAELAIQAFQVAFQEATETILEEV
ncbi:HNH endonuclease [Pseudomonas mandelii]|uniref:HNH endonuclease n=1 Tax=Pseudomonas mandelii TaxID=75612 RepID=UPI0018A6B76A|nr:HNH endonuclease domain-containing protein [Pseudomonas mandelii]